MTFPQLQTELKKKDWKSVYFFHGKEAYYIDEACKYLEENVLNETERAFNQTTLYGKDVNYKNVLDQAMRFPMMAERQLVVLKEAQSMKDIQSLKTYIAKPTQSTVLVICYKHKKLNMNTGLGKALKKSGSLIFESKQLYDNQVPQWINTYLKTKKRSINTEAGILIAEFLGTDLSKIANELDKMILNLPKEKQITPVEVEEYIGISKDYNVFELQKALATKDVLKANRIVNYFEANPKNGPMPVVVGSLFNFFHKLYLFHFVKGEAENVQLKTLGLSSSFFLRDFRAALRNYNYAKTVYIIDILQQYDMKSKGLDFNTTGKSSNVLLKELVWKVLHI